MPPASAQGGHTSDGHVSLRPPCPLCPCVPAGPGGPPADRWAGRSHGCGLAWREPPGRPPALPVRGLAGLCGRAQLPCVARQPWAAQWPKAPRVRAPLLRGLWPPAGQVVPVVVALILPWPPGLQVSQPGGSPPAPEVHQADSCPTDGVLRLRHLLQASSQTRMS